MRNSIIFISSLNTTIKWCSATAIAYKVVKMLAIWQQGKRVLGTFSLRMRRNGDLGASGLAIRFGDPDFLWQHNNFTVGMHFHHVLEISLVHKRRNSVKSASGLKTAVIVVFSDNDFL